jgi:glycosyltransferase involved in cell wall biosynthesis
MKLDLIVSALPPLLDGIGDYTGRLAAELASRAQVRVITTRDRAVDRIEGVDIVPTFSPKRRRTMWRIVDTVTARRPDWVVLQFNQFSFGRWGLNPLLPMAMARVQRRCPGTRIAVMFHELFVPPTTWKFRLMRLWQIRQLRTLGRLADLVFFSIDPWVRQFGPWFPGRPVLHMPVGSNLPHVAVSRDDARQRLQIPADRFVLGMFGSARFDRNLRWVQAAARSLRDAGANAMLLYVGADGAAVRDAVVEIPVLAEGPLGGDEASRRLAAMDLYLAPFSDGVSTRRTSMLSGLQHGLPVVATRAEATDDLLTREDGVGIALSPADPPTSFAEKVKKLWLDPDRRSRIGRGGQELYDREFSWPRIGQRLLDALGRPAEVAAAGPDCVIGERVHA